jgi:endonuclease YncB( thermonuclease family)
MVPALAAALLAAASGSAHGEIVLDGTRVAVWWSDGDTFRVESGPRKDERVRLLGVNALESYGPVHRWGTWRPRDLEVIAKGAATVAAAAGGSCTSGGKDGYGRTLAACPEAERALVESGAAMVFAVDAPPVPALLEAQRRAQAAGAGMWKGGVPPRIPTSVHSAGEPDLHGARPYDRIVDTRTGVTSVHVHDETRTDCQEVCVGEGAERACMIYVQYEHRYRDRPACLRTRRAGDR